MTENNYHLGQVVSGVNQEQNNIDLRMEKARNSLIGLVGPAFAWKYLLSPKVKIQLFRTLNLTNIAIRPIFIFTKKTLFIL